MVVLTATCRNGRLELDQPLPTELEGKQVQIRIQTLKHTPKRQRKAGSARGLIKIAPDFDAPLEDFADYMS